MKRLLLSLGLVLVAVGCRDSGAPPTGPTPSGFIKAGKLANQGDDGTLFEGVCVRAKGKPVAQSFTFSGAGFEENTFTLEVEDNGVQGLNGTIELNGETVVTHPMLGGNGPVLLQIPVTIATDNTIVCKLEGKPGSGLSFFVNVNP
jgi:hypothetical protein